MEFKYCKKCGTRNMATDAICKKCGITLDNVTTYEHIDEDKMEESINPKNSALIILSSFLPISGLISLFMNPADFGFSIIVGIVGIWITNKNRQYKAYSTICYLLNTLLIMIGIVNLIIILKKVMPLFLKGTMA